DNKQYTITLRVNDGDTVGEKTSLATILNVAPTLTAGYNFQVQKGTSTSTSGHSAGGSDGGSDGNGDGGSDGGSDGGGDTSTSKLATLRSGRLPDPGFT